MSEVRAIKRQCDHCGHWVDHEICTEYKWTEELDYNLVTWRILKCTRCWSPTFLEIRSNDEYNYYQCETFYPNSRRLLRDLQAVPQAIRKAYEAALKVKNVEPNAFAVLVGRTLEIMCKCENVQGRVLADKLRNLGDSGRIPQVLAQMALQLKQLRNLGAHVAEDEVKEGDVPIILEFVEAILEYLYVAPEKIAKVQARLDQVH